MTKRAVKGASGIEKINGYLIPSTSPVFNDFRFLIQAETRDETRYFMSGVHVEREGKKTFYVCTDGRRLHKLEYENHDIDLQPGDYDIRACKAGLILCPKKEKTDFPNWRGVIPTDNKKHFTFEFSSNGKDNTVSHELFLFYEAIGGVVNMAFFEPLRDPLCSKWEVSFRDGNSAIIFKARIRTAVIMPLQREDAIQVRDDSNIIAIPAPATQGVKIKAKKTA